MKRQTLFLFFLAVVQGTVIIGITGGSGAGKSIMSNIVKDRLEKL